MREFRVNSKVIEGYDVEETRRRIPAIWDGGVRILLYPGALEAFGEKHPADWWKNRANVRDLVFARYPGALFRQNVMRMWDDYGDIRVLEAERRGEVWERDGRPDILSPQVRQIQDALDTVLLSEVDLHDAWPRIVIDDNTGEQLSENEARRRLGALQPAESEELVRGR